MSGHDPLAPFITPPRRPLTGYAAGGVCARQRAAAAAADDLRLTIRAGLIGAMALAEFHPGRVTEMLRNAEKVARA